MLEEFVSDSDLDDDNNNDKIGSNNDKIGSNNDNIGSNDLDDPLLRAARLTQEDWCIMEWSDEHEAYCLTGNLIAMYLNINCLYS